MWNIATITTLTKLGISQYSQPSVFVDNGDKQFNGGRGSLYLRTYGALNSGSDWLVGNFTSPHLISSLNTPPPPSPPPLSPFYLFLYCFLLSLVPTPSGLNFHLLSDFFYVFSHLIPLGLGVVRLVLETRVLP